MFNKELYYKILSGHIPNDIVTSLGYSDPAQQIKIGNIAVVSLNVGENTIQKIALGQNSIWDADPNA